MSRRGACGTPEQVSFLLAKSPCSFSPMMELGRSARTLRRPGRALRATGSPCATPRSQRPEDGSPPCSLSAISGWRDGVLYPLARGCRRIWRGADRPARAACWPRRRFFLAKSPCSFSPMMELGRSAPTLLPAPGERCELRGRRAQQPDDCDSPKMGLRRALSPPFPAGEMVFFIAWRVAADESGAAHLDRLGPPGCAAVAVLYLLAASPCSF